MTQLVVLEQLKPLEIFTPEGTDDILARLRKEAKSHVLDISTSEGRDQIRSLAYKIAKSKTYLDDMGKDLVADQKEQIKLVDAERKRIRDALDDLKDEIRAPLTEWENREEDRVKAHEEALRGFDAATVFTGSNPPSADVQVRIDGLEALYSRNWEEFAKRAQLARDAANKRLSDVLAASQKYEAEQIELERLRREDTERKEREREEQIRAEAAAKAKAEAEAQAKVAAEAESTRVQAQQEQAENERMRLQQEKEAAEREKAEAEARAQKSEAERIAAVQKAEADRIAAEERAKAEQLAAEERAKQEAAAAAKRERDKIDAEQKAEAEAAAEREADKKHRAKINNEALKGLRMVLDRHGPLEAEGYGKIVIEAIAKGLIPHVKISY